MVDEHVARPRTEPEPGASSGNSTFPLVRTRTAGLFLAGDADADTVAAVIRRLAGDADADTDATGRPRRPALASELLVPRM
jgi:hypothetical protein